MKEQQKKRKYANIYLHILGYLFCIVPPLVCTLTYFPIWKSTGGFKISALCALVVVLAIFPLIRLIKRLLRSDATYILWLILFLAFYSLSKIADEMTVISLVGFVSNSIGAIILKLSGGRNERKRE
jgi:chromate transport protein ChrA